MFKVSPLNNCGYSNIQPSFVSTTIRFPVSHNVRLGLGNSLNMSKVNCSPSARFWRRRPLDGKLLFSSPDTIRNGIRVVVAAKHGPKYYLKCSPMPINYYRAIFPAAASVYYYCKAAGVGDGRGTGVKHKTFLFLKRARSVAVATATGFARRLIYADDGDDDYDNDDDNNNQT